jgi:hypothetical protein
VLSAILLAAQFLIAANPRVRRGEIPAGAHNKGRKPMSKMKLEIYSKNLYGTIRHYPNCKLSQALASIMGRKTFFDSDIETLRKAGFGFSVYNMKGDVIELLPIK